MWHSYSGRRELRGVLGAIWCGDDRLNVRPSTRWNFYRSSYQGWQFNTALLPFRALRCFKRGVVRGRRAWHQAEQKVRCCMTPFKLAFWLPYYHQQSEHALRFTSATASFLRMLNCTIARLNEIAHAIAKNILSTHSIPLWPIYYCFRQKVHFTHLHNMLHTRRLVSMVAVAWLAGAIHAHPVACPASALQHKLALRTP